MESTLTIAQTGFSITSDLDLYYPAEAGSIIDFTSDLPCGADIHVAVNIQKGCRAAFENMELLAEAESAWKLLRDGDYRWFVSCLEMKDGCPAWAARMDAACENVSIGFILPSGVERGRMPTPLLYPLDQLLLIHVLAPREGLILHGTGVRRGDEAIALLGVSGAGKTTLAEILDKHSDFEILSDDRVIVRKQNGCWRAYGTPWPGEGGFALNGFGVLKNICFLKQSETNELVSLDKKSVFERIAPVASIPWYDEKLMNSAVSFAESMAGATPGYDLLFRRDDSVIKLVESMFEL